MGVHVYNISTWETEAGGVLETEAGGVLVTSQPGLLCFEYSKFKINPGCIDTLSSKQSKIFN
jgi:hypothetical protein